MKSREWCLFDVHDTLISSKIYMSIYQPVITRLMSEKGVPFSKLNNEMERLKGISGNTRADSYNLCESFNALDVYYQELSKQLTHSAIKSDLVKLFNALKDMKKKVGIVSNSHKRTVKMILEHHGLLDKVNLIFCEEDGGQKDSLPFWQKLTSKTGIEPENAVLIDNDKNSTDNAEVLGFKTILINGIIGFDVLRYIN